MNKTTCNIKFHSSLAPLIEKFVQEKHACGYKYSTGIDSLRRLDRLLCQHKLEAIELPKALVELWISKNPNETSRTHRARIGLVRQLADFMIRHGYSAYLPDARLAPKGQSVFVPRIFSHEEMRELLNAAEGIVANPRSPLRHLVMPQILQLLYGCGLRVGEVIRLRVDDVDLFSGVLTIRQSKFRKDRLVPIAPSLAQRLRHYADALGHRDPKAMFFPAPHMSSYHRQTIYYAFRQLLWQCRIPHGGRGRGPRLHDIRHTFAVHRLVKWYREGADLRAKLPVLATYMGHLSFTETQVYIQFTADIFPDLSARSEAAFGYVIPRRRHS